MSPRRLVAVALGAAMISTLAAPLRAATPYRERVREEVLPNGFKVILLEDHKAPVAVVQVWYRVGSRNESAGSTGLSHLLEHMMFRGTQKHGPEEYSRIIQRNGGQTNAFTNNDYTTYFATLASDRVPVVVELEADRMSNLVITDAQYVPERDVVQEERRLRTDNNPVASLYEQLAATAFVAHTYQQPIIGWMSDVARSTADDLLRHYKTYYVPNNAFLVAVGDLDAESLLAEVRKQFGTTPTAPMPPPVRAQEPVQQGERRVDVVREAELPYVALGYHVPNLDSADAAALEVLAQVLAGGESARLHRHLVYEKRLARHANANYEYVSADPSLFVFDAQALPGKTAATLEKALLEEIEQCRKHPVTARELEKAKNGIEAGFVFGQDSLFYQGLLLGQYEIVGGWRRVDDYLPAVRAVTAEDLMRVANSYLDEKNRTVATLVPVPPKPGSRPAPPAPQGPMGPVH